MKYIFKKIDAWKNIMERKQIISQFYEIYNVIIFILIIGKEMFDVLYIFPNVIM